MQPLNTPISAEIAKLLHFEFPEECRPGIEANLELMQKHTQIVDRYLTKLNTSALATKDPG